ncbi:MAG: hypothetical protein GY906_19850, partial [bacterium]|nr:hypothetical protein [bacterium]
MKRTPQIASLIAVLAISALVATAQESSIDEEAQKATRRQIGGLEFVDEIDVTVANVIVHVTDDDGSPITTLT